MTLTNPTPNSFDLDQKLSYKSSSSMHPTVHAFNVDLSFAGNSDPFSTLHFPTFKSKDGATVHNSQKLDMDNPDSFVEFVQSLITKPSVDMYVNGKADVNMPSLFEKTVDYKHNINVGGMLLQKKKKKNL